MVRGPGTLSMGHQVAEDTHRRDLRECSLLRPDRGAERELLCRLLTAAPVHGCQPREAQLSPTRPGLPLGRGQGPWAQRPYRAPPPPHAQPPTARILALPGKEGETGGI